MMTDSGSLSCFKQNLRLILFNLIYYNLCSLLTDFSFDLLKFVAAFILCNAMEIIWFKLEKFHDARVRDLHKGSSQKSLVSSAGSRPVSLKKHSKIETNLVAQNGLDVNHMDEASRFTSHVRTTSMRSESGSCRDDISVVDLKTLVPHSESTRNKKESRDNACQCESVLLKKKKSTIKLPSISYSDLKRESTSQEVLPESVKEILAAVRSVVPEVIQNKLTVKVPSIPQMANCRPMESGQKQTAISPVVGDLPVISDKQQAVIRNTHRKKLVKKVPGGSLSPVMKRKSDDEVWERKSRLRCSEPETEQKIIMTAPASKQPRLPVQPSSFIRRIRSIRYCLRNLVRTTRVLCRREFPALAVFECDSTEMIWEEEECYASTCDSEVGFDELEMITEDVGNDSAVMNGATSGMEPGNDMLDGIVEELGILDMVVEGLPEILNVESILHDIQNIATAALTTSDTIQQVSNNLGAETNADCEQSGSSRKRVCPFPLRSKLQ